MKQFWKWLARETEKSTKENWQTTTFMENKELSGAQSESWGHTPDSSTSTNLPRAHNRLLRLSSS